MGVGGSSGMASQAKLAYIWTSSRWWGVCLQENNEALQLFTIEHRRLSQNKSTGRNVSRGGHTIAAIFDSQLLDLLVGKTVMLIHLEVGEDRGNGTGKGVIHVVLRGDKTPEGRRQGNRRCTTSRVSIVRGGGGYTIQRETEEKLKGLEKR